MLVRVAAQLAYSWILKPQTLPPSFIHFLVRGTLARPTSPGIALLSRAVACVCCSVFNILFKRKQQFTKFHRFVGKEQVIERFIKYWVAYWEVCVCGRTTTAATSFGTTRRRGCARPPTYGHICLSSTLSGCGLSRTSTATARALVNGIMLRGADLAFCTRQVCDLTFVHIEYEQGVRTSIATIYPFILWGMVVLRVSRYPP